MKAIALLLAGATVLAQPPSGSWLDRPLSNWNDPGRGMPRATAGDETAAEVTTRCKLQTLRSTAGERAVAEAGWLPFHIFDRQVVARDVEIVGGLIGADGMCRPTEFNLFVFVGGTFAGALSPTTMDSRSDGGIGGAVRVAPDDTISAGFHRYTDTAPLCCPSGRVTVRYRIDRTVAPPVVVPVSVQVIRQ